MVGPFKSLALRSPATIGWPTTSMVVDASEKGIFKVFQALPPGLMLTTSERATSDQV